MRQFFYYKIQQFLQNGTILFQNVGVITKCDVYYERCLYIFARQGPKYPSKVHKIVSKYNLKSIF